MSTSTPIIVLVHGTWPYGPLHSFLERFALTRRWADSAPRTWSNPDQPFPIGLKQVLPFEARVLEFFWSGLNGPSARREGAIELAKFIDLATSTSTSDGEVQCQPADVVEVFVIAHSHGGNVAVDASRLTRRPLAGVACMSTPFISVTPRMLAESEQHMLEYAGRLLLIALSLAAIPFAIAPLTTALAPFAAALGFDPGGPSPFFFSIGAFFGGIWLTLACLYRLDQHRLGIHRGFQRWLDRWRTWHSMKGPSIPFLAIRATGDEAFAALMLGQISNSVERLLTRSIAKFTSRVLAPWWSQLPWLVYLVLSLGWGALISLSPALEIALTQGAQGVLDYFDFKVKPWFVLPLIKILPLLIFTAMVWLRIAMVVLTTAIFLGLTIVAAIPFGPGNFLLLPWMELHVEPTVPDQATETKFLSKRTASDAKLGFRHAIYTIPESWETIGAWIARLSKSHLRVGN